MASVAAWKCRKRAVTACSSAAPRSGRFDAGRLLEAVRGLGGLSRWKTRSSVRRHGTYFAVSKPSSRVGQVEIVREEDLLDVRTSPIAPGLPSPPGRTSFRRPTRDASASAATVIRSPLKSRKLRGDLDLNHEYCTVLSIRSMCLRISADRGSRGDTSGRSGSLLMLLAEWGKLGVIVVAEDVVERLGGGREGIDVGMRVDEGDSGDFLIEGAGESIDDHWFYPFDERRAFQPAWERDAAAVRSTATRRLVPGVARAAIFSKKPCPFAAIRAAIFFSPFLAIGRIVKNPSHRQRFFFPLFTNRRS